MSGMAHCGRLQRGDIFGQKKQQNTRLLLAESIPAGGSHIDRERCG